MNIDHPKFSFKDLTQEQIVELIREYPPLAMKLLKNKEWNGNLDLRFYTSLKSLPEGLVVGGYLWLGHCTSLKSLPEGLVVGGYLWLAGCISLQSLPEGLVVGGDLCLSGCISLQSLPKGLKIKGTLDIEDCPLLKKKYKNTRGMKKAGIEVQGEVFWQ